MSRSSGRRAALLLCLLFVLALHAGLLGWVQQTRLQWGVSGAAAPMPQRIAVDFVREIKVQAPSPQPPARSRTSSVRARPREPVVAPDLAQDAAVLPDLAASAASPLIQAASEAAPVLAAGPAASAAEASASSASSAMAMAAQTPASAADFVPGAEWPLSTRLRYRLTGQYRGELHGQAQVEWLREGTHYQMHLDVAIGPSFAPFIARHLSSDGELTANGISPRRYDEDTRVFFSTHRRVTLWFKPDEVQLSDGHSEPRPAGVQDAASQFVQLTWLFLTGRETLAPARQLVLPLALPRKLYSWRYEVRGQERLDTPLGALDTWHLVPLMEGSIRDLKAEVWLAPALQYLPMRMRIRQDDQTYVDLLIDSTPVQAAPDAVHELPNEPAGHRFH
ncbi:MAG: DUF3108 domain-containing protein [Paucibacter sp.]|nr:DUF3108 domain-containing protein [Roseateles sp.]